MKTKSTIGGQAIIVLVMVVAIVAIMFTHVSLLNINALGLSNELYESVVLRIKAEGYLEDAAMRFLRDTSFEGETLNEGDILCTIDVTDLGGVDRDFESSCSRGGRTKSVGMNVTFAGGIFLFSKIVEQ